MMEGNMSTSVVADSYLCHYQRKETMFCSFCSCQYKMACDKHTTPICFCSFAEQTCFLPPNPNGPSSQQLTVLCRLLSQAPFHSLEFLHSANSGVNVSQAPGFRAEQTDRDALTPANAAVSAPASNGKLSDSLAGFTYLRAHADMHRKCAI